MSTIEQMPLSPEDRRAIQHAKNLLANPGLVAQMTNLIGTPIEAAVKKLPKGFNKRLGDAIETALTKSARLAQKTLKDSGEEPWNKAHMLSVAATGGAAGFVGPWAMIIEIPITTTLIFRSIADIARSEGENIQSADSIQECIKVFALGGPSKKDDAAESGYYAVRASLAAEVQASVNFLAKQLEQAAAEAASNAAKKATEQSVPALVRLIQKVAEKLGLTYSEKVAAQIVPVIGAASGAAINVIFLEHFQSMATGHFTVRRLERKYGEAEIKKVYDSLPDYEEIPEESALVIEGEIDNR